MCYRQVVLRNNSLHYNTTHMPFRIVCSCGKCLACKATRKRDWFVRSYAEWQRCKELRGLSTFYTLTYDDEHLPVTDGFAHFSLRDIQLFCKRLKKYLSKDGMSLRYIIVCEFGDLFQRPHYHTNFFVTAKDNNKLLSPLDFRKVVMSTWQNGFVMPGKNNGVIQDVRGLKYVTKYVTKDVGFNALPFFIKIARSAVREWLSLYGSTHSSLRDWYNEFRYSNKGSVIYDFGMKYASLYKQYTPFVTASTHYGMSILDTDFVDVDRELVTIHDGKRYKSVSLPLYLRRKLFYKRVPNERDGKCTKYVLNDFGIRHMVSTIEDRVDSFAKDFELWTRSYCPDYNDLVAVEKHYPEMFRTPISLQLFIRNCSLLPHYIALYKYVFRYRSIEFFRELCGFECRDYVQILDLWKFFYLRILTFCERKFDVPLTDYCPERLLDVERKLLEEDSFFSSCFVYLNIYEILSNVHKESQSLYFERENAKRREIRQRRKMAEYNRKINYLKCYYEKSKE